MPESDPADSRSGYRRSVNRTHSSIDVLGQATNLPVPNALAAIAISNPDPTARVDSALSIPVCDVSWRDLKNRTAESSTIHTPVEAQRSIEKVLDRAHAHVTEGRNGRATVPDSNLNSTLTTSQELGGGGGDGALM
ncbi:hypothetical protein [Paraburkholderia aromaticivorans]|uniref:hypothetical protein n=1 Tax=Paraburkholderia aromaticivorans TaxID=2026199 RepID=UPI003D67A5A7